jgi:hypothetical protein
MSEEAAAAVVLPAADQPPAVVKELPFAQRLEAKEREMGSAGDDETPEVAAPAAKPKAATADPKEGKLAQLKALAGELGFALEDTGVTVAERAEHRAAIRRQKAQLEQERAAFLKDKGDFDSNKGEKVARAEALLAALESGDPDGFSKHAGFKDFNDFQTNFLKRLADPNYSELKKLQERVEAAEKEKAKIAEEAKQRADGEQRAKAMDSYMSNLTATCQKSANPLVQAMADDPLFLQAVFAIQRDHWDPETESTLTVEQAIKKAAKGARTDLESELRGLHERLSKGFAAPAVPAKVVALNGGGKKPAPKTAVVPASANGGGAVPKSVGEMSPAEWAKYKAARFAEAED